MPDKRQIALRRALPILFFTVLFGVVLGLLAWRGVQNAADLSAGSEAFAQYARVCEGSALPVATVFDRQTAEHPTVVFRETSAGWILDRSVIPESDFPSSLGEVQLTLCVGRPEVVSLPPCDDKAGQPVTGTRLPLQLIAAGNGVLIRRGFLGLDAPADGCWPADEPVPGEPTDADVWSWVSPFVNSRR